MPHATSYFIFNQKFKKKYKKIFFIIIFINSIISVRFKLVIAGISKYTLNYFSVVFSDHKRVYKRDQQVKVYWPQIPLRMADLLQGIFVSSSRFSAGIMRWLMHKHRLLIKWRCIPFL